MRATTDGFISETGSFQAGIDSSHMPGTPWHSDRVDIDWPAGWQAEARDALLPHVGLEERVEIVVGDPSTSIGGSLLAGCVFLEGSELRIIHDLSGRDDVHASPLMAGPVLRIELLQPPRRRRVLYAHPAWSPPPR